MEQELISIIIPVYNVEQYLCRCLDSVVNQTYKNLEIILVDDGSCDSSGKICDEYSQKDNRIRVIHKKNGGVSSARNVGIDVAKGTYLSFVDSDDYINEQFIEILYKLLNDHGADIAQCDYVKTAGEIPENILHENIDIFDNLGALDAMYHTNGVQMVIVCNKLFKTELFENIRFPIGIRYEDEAMSPLLIYNSKRIVTTDEQMYYYFDNGNSFMNSQFSVRKFDVFSVFNSRIDFYVKNHLRKYALLDLEKLTYKCMEFYKLSNEKSVHERIKKQIKYNFKLALKLKVSFKNILRYFLYTVHPVFMDIIYKNYMRKKQ